MTNEDQITALEKQLSGLERLLDDAIGKTADDAVGDDGADAAEIAELQAEVSKLDRTLRDAITKVRVRRVSGGFEQVCADIQKRDGCSRVIALQKARTEAPDAFIAYQRSGVTIAKAAGPQMDRIVRSPFDDLVDGIRAHWRRRHQQVAI
jgi:hypothetical protein